MIFSLNAPMVDFLILAVIAKEDAYGYQISQIIKRASSTKDSALYPVLRRLQECRYLTTYDRQYQGRNRKYYTITEEGMKYYETLSEEWKSFKAVIDDIINGGIADEQN